MISCCINIVLKGCRRRVGKKNQDKIQMGTPNYKGLEGTVGLMEGRLGQVKPCRFEIRKPHWYTRLLLLPHLTI